MLVVPLLESGASATSGETNVAHAVTLGVMSVMLLALTIWTAKGASKRKGGCFYKWGPTVMIGMSIFLSNANNIRQVLQDNDVWKSSTSGLRGFAGPGLFASSTAYICADSDSHCCPSTDPQYGATPWKTFYDSGCNATAGTPSCPHLDIPWTFVCDAGRGASYVQDFLALPCKENEGPLLKGGHWGCTVKGAATNKDALVALTNNTFVFGRKTGESTFRQAPNAADCAAEKIPLESCGWLNMMEHGCHQNMGITCLNSTGFAIIIVCVYSGFALLFIGSLWQAKICKKIDKARAQWGELRGENKSSGYTGHSPAPAPEAECKD